MSLAHRCGNEMVPGPEGRGSDRVGRGLQLPPRLKDAFGVRVLRKPNVCGTFLALFLLELDSLACVTALCLHN